MPNVQPQLRDEERTRCEIWTRVMGYFRPVSSFNIGKKQEFADRVPFRLEGDDENRRGTHQAVADG